MQYLTPQQIVDFNAMALEQIAVKKKDKHAVLRYSQIQSAIECCRSAEGDAYDKAAILLVSLVQGHPFASGNRRTALLAVADFLAMNDQRVAESSDDESTELLKGVREGFYTQKHVSQWLRTGKINGRKTRDSSGNQGPL